MTYVVTESCIRCKYMDCVEVCPVDAIVPDSDDKATAWVEQNREYAVTWPNITRKGEAPADADDWKDVKDKAKLFSPEPGKP
jgi:ferredoxin